MERLDKQRWLTEGFTIIESEGFARITVENLCERLQRSKGSFYFHFKNMDGYTEALMVFWLEENTLSLIRKANLVKDVGERKKKLNKLSQTLSMKLEQNIRAWAYSNEIVKKHLKEVDKIRLDCLIEMEVLEGKSYDEARDCGMLTNAMFVGLQQLFPDLSHKERLRLASFFRKDLL